MITEQEIAAVANKAPRITPADIEANIASEHYFTAQDGADGAVSHGAKQVPALSLLTFCVLVLRNGFTVTGESACASPENFDAEIGRKIARQNAVNKVWPLMGYALKEKLHRRQDVGACSDVITGADALFIADAYIESLESPKQPNDKLKQAKAEYDRASGKVVLTGEDK